MDNTILEFSKTMNVAITRLAGEVEAQGKIIEQLTRILYTLPDMQKRGISYINKEKIDYEIETSKLCLVNDKKAEERESRLIVSLTSFPERMYDIKYTLFSLVSQSLKPDKIILWLSHEEFPNHEEDIAPSLLRLIDMWGITIGWCENMRSYKKIIPTLLEYPDDIIITADDDIFYPSEWLELLYVEYMKNGCICCHRAHRILVSDDIIMPYTSWGRASSEEATYDTFMTGAGGVLYPPHSLHEDVIDVETFVELCPSADDIWLWAMALRNKSKIKVVESNIDNLTYVNPERELRISGEYTLGITNLGGGKNDIQINNLIQCYPEIMEILLSTIER